MIDDRNFGPEPETPADLQRERDREGLEKGFEGVGKTICDRNDD